MHRVVAGYPYTPSAASWAVAALLFGLCLLGAAAALLLLASSVPLQRALTSRVQRLASAARHITTSQKLLRMGTMVSDARAMQACCTTTRCCAGAHTTRAAVRVGVHVLATVPAARQLKLPALTRSIAAHGAVHP